jgi:hypothetical protein
MINRTKLLRPQRVQVHRFQVESSRRPDTSLALASNLLPPRVGSPKAV